MTARELLFWLSLWQIAMAAFTLLLLLNITAPYGRHARGGWGPKIGGRLTWALMELPACLGFALVFFQGENAWQPVPLLIFAFWQLHYIHRTFVYPLLARGTPKPWPVLVVSFGFLFQLYNASINAWWVAEAGNYSLAWLTSPAFILGSLLFLTGFFINLQSDAILRRLRGPGETGYKIPYGGFYRFVSAPNYFGELLEWVGFALLTWSPTGLAFALYTFANLVPRALAHHRWYAQEFAEYPKERKAIIPYLL